MQTINPTDLKYEIKDNIRVGLNTMIWGGPGIGKSDIPQQVAQEAGIPLLDFRANLFDPVDVRGIPHIMKEQETGKHFTRWAVPDVFPIASRDGETGILFIDELPTAPPATQNAFLQLLLTREIGDYKMPVGWSIIAAGNRLTDAAAVYQMPSPVRNRLAHYELEASIDDWVEWAFKSGINAEVIGFLRYRPGLLNSFKADEYAFPTPRSWAFVDKKLSNRPSTSTDETLFFGVSALVGDGPAGEFVAYKQIADQLQDVDALILDPGKYKKDDNPAVLYALSTSIATRANKDNIKNIVKVCSKLPSEFQVILMKGLFVVDRELVKHESVSKWIQDNHGLLS
tara:strand:- start:315 stop:1337 length:1023 start_codon:yes stop_codon:yes gene_type:complete